MNPFSEDQMTAMLYASMSKGLKEQVRPTYPEIDSLPEPEAIEFCLAFNRAKTIIARTIRG